MGMSTNIQAFIPDTDPEYQKHKKVFLFCQEQEVSLPKETAEYFGCDEEEYYTHEMEDKIAIQLEENVHYEEYHDDMEEGIEVYISTLPKNVSKIRFVTSW